MTGTDCIGGAGPVAGAVVHLDGERSDVMLITGEDGGYLYWMPANNNPLQVIVTADGYIRQSARGNIRPGKDRVVDLHLEAIC